MPQEMKDGKAVLQGMAGITGFTGEDGHDKINAGQGSYSVLS